MAVVDKARTASEAVAKAMTTAAGPCSLPWSIPWVSLPGFQSVTP